MTNEQQEHMNRAKSWCFDNGVTETQIQTAWDNALNQEVHVIKNLDKNGHKWWWLPPHLLKQLNERYLDSDSTADAQAKPGAV